MDITKKLGKKVKSIRLAKGLSQGKLAVILSVKTPYISQIERGFNNLSIKSIEKIAKALKVSVIDLLK